MERRLYQRFYFTIPMKYQVQVPESTDNPWMSSGVLRNISYGGLYFSSKDKPPLKKGQIRDFTITSGKEHPNYPEITFVIAKGRVVRIDPPRPDHPDIGVALEFVLVDFIGNF
jgi:hypothetical protein